MVDYQIVNGMMMFVADEVIKNEELLSDADRSIGDGDHGLGMKRGFSEVKKKLLETNPLTIENIFQISGHALIASMGGASGPIFGMLFIKGADAIKDCNNLDSSSLFSFLKGGCDGIGVISQAKLGDKTMLDVLIPARDAAKKAIDKPLPEAFLSVEESAKLGVENTKKMIAKIGRATTLGDRSIGHPDPGALSLWVILKAASEYINNY
tara:strand:+ start:13420 stop:14046 length:627 start_codon:yes stop_codon:yes gene_type:complete